MNTKKLIITSLLTVICAMGASAQEFYDITKYYLQNTDFSQHVDYGVDAAAGNVKNGTLIVPDGWTAVDGSKATLSAIATFSYGTAATFGGKSIPATGPDGTANGACLTLSSAFGSHAKFYQEVSLPAGNYRLQVTYYNCNPDADGGQSASGWVTGDGSILSSTTSFGHGEWRSDIIAFTLDKETSGQLYLGFEGNSKTTTAAAMLAIDNVKLLRDVPYGEADVTGDVPTVVSDLRFARGATMAFGRIKTVTIGEGKVTEKGFCWSENPEPTVKDNTSTETLSNGIYCLRGLKPATKYYMRAYAKTAGKQVGYGQTIKFYTLPKGNVTYWYNNGGDNAANTRVNNAAKEACDIFSNLTEMVKNFSIGYSAGTPTADCYYGDDPWMNMGANASYQRTGTIMHEMQHGFGVIPYTTQWAGSILRSGNGTGQWLGDRVSAFLDFWDNTTGSRLNGDTQHMWPYGINGASEDHGNIADYYANAMIGQALGEDGLEHRSNTFAEPYYALDQEDDVKYYLKNESEDRGLYTSYLIPTSTGTLKWRVMTAAEAQQNDSAAWYITFTPQNQYYQFRNVATGQYLTYASGVKTMTRTSLTSSDNWHLMKGRVDVGSGSNAKRGYWVIHPTGNLTPSAMQANANGAVANATFNLANSAKAQRWLILTAEEMVQQENAAKETLRKEIAGVLTDIKALAEVPHAETAEGTDQAFADAIADIEQRMSGDNFAELISLSDEALAAANAFLSNVIATDQPFDLTFRLQSPGMDTADGWTAEPTIDYSCAEFYERAFDLNQTVSNLPAGDYVVKVQGFQRPGTSENACNDYAAGTNNVNASLYAGSKNVRINHIAVDAQSTNLGGTKVNGKYIPNTMSTASKYFAKGLYENTLETTVAKDGSSLKIGLRSTSMPNAYWVIFDNFRLQYYGKQVKGDLDRDGRVTVTDVTRLTEVIATGGTDTKADLNGDGKVDIADVINLLNTVKQ